MCVCVSRRRSLNVYISLYVFKTSQSLTVWFKRSWNMLHFIILRDGLQETPSAVDFLHEHIEAPFPTPRPATCMCIRPSHGALRGAMGSSQFHQRHWDFGVVGGCVPLWSRHPPHMQPLVPGLAPGPVGRNSTGPAVDVEEPTRDRHPSLRDLPETVFAETLKIQCDQPAIL